MLCQTFMARGLQTVPHPFNIHCHGCLCPLPQHYLKSTYRVPVFPDSWLWVLAIYTYFKHGNSSNAYFGFREKKNYYLHIFFLCLLCFTTIHLPPNRILQKCKGLWGDEVRSLDEALSVCVMAVWGPGKMKNRRARRLNI